MQKAVTYVRVSSKEQHEQGYSPEAQRRSLYDFARQNGFDIVEEFEDAETAKRAGRAAFSAMLAYVRERGIKHILVEKTDRLYRNFVDYGKVDDLIGECDVAVHLVKEGSSLGINAKASDKLMHGIRTVMAKHFIDNLVEETKKGQNEKVAHGEYPSKAPLGYMNVHDPVTKKNIIIVDEQNRSLILSLFSLYATGTHSLQSVIQAVENAGLTANVPNSRKLNKTTASNILRNPFYIGHFHWNKQTHKGSHEAIIDADLWQKTQDVLSGKNVNKAKKHNVVPFAFKGLLTCGECRRSVTAEIKKGRYVYYRCTKYQTECSQQAVKEEVLSNEVGALLDRLQGISENGVAYVTAALKQSLEMKRGWHDRAYEDMLAEKTRLKQRLDRMYEDRLDGKITGAFYDEKRGEYETRIADLDIKIAKHDRADINYYDFGLRILELAKNAKKLYEAANPTEKRELLGFLLSNSTLKDKKPEFALKSPFFEIAKRSPLGERSAWGGQWESNP
jgi:site-specific DNA recombinase